MATFQDIGVGGRFPRQAFAAALAGLLLLGGALWLGAGYGWRHGALFATGGALGIVLYHAAFGFTGAWRVFFTQGRAGGVKAQAVMLALATAAFLPILDGGSLFGRPVVGSVAPAGVSVTVGAFLFGIGMQLGGGCASGSLYTAGGGNLRMIVTLLFFIVGSLIGTLHAPWWYALPGFGAVSIADAWGVWPALAAQLGLFAAIYALASRRERRTGSPSYEAKSRTGIARLWQGPWPLLWGAVGLALLNLVTLALAGHPWSITFGFSLWGAKAALAAGLDVASWTYWTWPFPASALRRSIFAEVTSVMDIGILLGAFAAAGLAGRLAPRLDFGWRGLVAAVIGGLLLGYGARLAFGCNIGAFFSGVASGSLHGWLWLLTALPGNLLGIYLRPLFGLAVERAEA